MSDQEPSRAPLLARIVGTALFAGYLPSAPGTFGTLAGLLVLLIPGTEQPLVLGSMILLGIAAGVPAAWAIARAEGNRLTPLAKAAKEMFQEGQHKQPDPSVVVIDEVVGIWITLFLIPKTVLAYVLGFFLFRAMDILKPEPARALEAIPHGWGILLDDIVAGVYANLLVRVLLLAAGALFPGI